MPGCCRNPKELRGCLMQLLFALTVNCCFLALQELLACLKQLLLVDRSWLPAREGYSIYIRPFAFASCELIECCCTLRCRPPPREGCSIHIPPRAGSPVAGCLLAAGVLCMPSRGAPHPLLH